MNQLKQDTNGAMVDPAPLFASSWAALFTLLRHGLAKGRGEATVSAGSHKAGTQRHN